MDYSLLVGIHEEGRVESDDDLDGDVTNGRSENDDSAEDSPSSPPLERPVMGRSNSVTSGEVPMDGERYAINSSQGIQFVGIDTFEIFRVLKLGLCFGFLFTYSLKHH